MKKKVVLSCLSFLIVIALPLVSCGKSTSTPTSSTTYTGTPTLKEISVIPAGADNLAIGNVQHFSAIGTYTDGSIVDITKKVTWASSNTAVATISFDTTSLSGAAMGVGAGKTNITASLSGITSPVAVLQVANVTSQPK